MTSSSSPSASSIPSLKNSTDEVEFLNYWLRDQQKKGGKHTVPLHQKPLRSMDGYTYYAKFCEQYSKGLGLSNNNKNKFDQNGSVYGWLLRNTHHAQNHRLGNYFYRPYSRRHSSGGTATTAKI